MSVLERRTSRGRSPEPSRRSILEATERLLADGASFAELTVSRLASAASMSRPTFYTYFSDRRELVLALGKQFEERTHAAADDWLEMRDDDLHETLFNVLGAFREDHPILRAIVEAATYDEEVARFWRAFHARFIAAVERRAAELTPGRDTGAVRADAFALIWMTQRTLAEHLDAPDVSDEQLIDALVRLWRSVLPVTAIDA